MLCHTAYIQKLFLLSEQRDAELDLFHDQTFYCIIHKQMDVYHCVIVLHEPVEKKIFIYILEIIVIVDMIKMIASIFYTFVDENVLLIHVVY